MDPETLEKLRRSSGLALTKEGVWTWGTGFVENPRVQTMFHAGVAVRDDGEVTLSVGHMWAYVKAEVTAFFIRSIGLGASAAGDAAPGDAGVVSLLGDRALPIAALRVAGWGPDERLYLWLDGLSGPAICLRDIHQRLINQMGDDGRELTVGDRRVPLVMLPTIPRANTPAPS